MYQVIPSFITGLYAGGKASLGYHEPESITHLAILPALLLPIYASLRFPQRAAEQFFFTSLGCIIGFSTGEAIQSIARTNTPFEFNRSYV